MIQECADWESKFPFHCLVNFVTTPASYPTLTFEEFQAVSDVLGTPAGARALIANTNL